MAWHIFIDVTADSRARAESDAGALLRRARNCGPGGLALERHLRSEGVSDNRLECGDPGLPYAPADVDLSIADEAEVAEWRARTGGTP